MKSFSVNENFRAQVSMVSSSSSDPSSSEDMVNGMNSSPVSAPKPDGPGWFSASSPDCSEAADEPVSTANRFRTVENDNAFEDSYLKDVQGKKRERERRK